MYANSDRFSFVSAKKSHYNIELTSRQYATIEYVNSIRSSKKMPTQDLFKHGMVNRPVEDMACLTLPPAIEDSEKYIPTNVSNNRQTSACICSRHGEVVDLLNLNWHIQRSGTSTPNHMKSASHRFSTRYQGSTAYYRCCLAQMKCLLRWQTSRQSYNL
ncbi:hypothetical protein BS78_05G231700 [Paspalum vaginatum]|nr:hypothetical protein BS78_05G231700 [Paspalum vaginatum]